MSTTTSRRKSRELALSCVYEIIVGKHDMDVVIERCIENQEVIGPVRDFLRESVTKAISYGSEVDAIIEELAQGWKINRIARVDMAILRLSIVELLLGLDDPPNPDPITINEAIVLAKKFSTEDSGKFINGILANIVRRKDEFRGRLTSKNENPAD